MASPNLLNRVPGSDPNRPLQDFLDIAQRERERRRNDDLDRDLSLFDEAVALIAERLKARREGGTA